MLAQVVVWLGVVIFTMLVFVVIVVLFQHRVARVSRRRSPGAWTGGCVDPKQSRAWSALVIDDSGMTVTSLWSKENRYTFRWNEVDVAATGSHEIKIGLRHPQGLRIQLVTGSYVDLLLPSRSLLHYPKARIADALAAMRKHR